MKVILHSNKFQITDAIKTYVEQKIDKFVDFYSPELGTLLIQINLSVIDNQHCVEVILATGELKIRLEETTPNIYQSIDLVEDKLKWELRKHQTTCQPRFSG